MTDKPLAIDAQNLQLTYPNGNPALHHFNLQVKQGDFFSLLGHNGAGKTSFISILCSLIFKTAGELRVLGYDITQDRMKIKSLLGLVPQEINLPAFETVENILLNNAGYHRIPHRTAKKRIKKLLTTLSLWTFRQRQSRALSGGMKRRLMMARALISQPHLLLLDEPTTGVDIEMREATWDFLKNLNEQEGMTILLTTHYLEEAEQLSKNIALMKDGQCMNQFSKSELFQQLSEVNYQLTVAQDCDQLPVDLNLHATRIAPFQFDIRIDAKESLTDILAALKKQGITVMQINKNQSTLEQVVKNILLEDKA